MKDRRHGITIRIPPTIREAPMINGTKPVEIPRISEEQKKHIRRDGKRITS
jgi:hypothetical protein